MKKLCLSFGLWLVLILVAVTNAQAQSYGFINGGAQPDVVTTGTYNISGSPVPNFVISTELKLQREANQSARQERRTARETQLQNSDLLTRIEEKINDVAESVQTILDKKTPGNGVSNVVSLVATQQRDGLEALTGRINRIRARAGIVSWLLGHDRLALKEVAQEAQTIEERVTKLEENLDFLGEVEREEVLDLIDGLKSLQPELVKLVEQKNQEFSVVGWFRNFFKLD